MKNTAFALLSTYSKIKFDDGSEKVSLSAPFIVSNDKFLQDTFNQCRKLKLDFRLVGFFQPLLDNEKEVLSSVFINTWKVGEDGYAEFFDLSSKGRQFVSFRNRLFECADRLGFELLYQGFNEWQKNKNSKGDNSNGSQGNE